MNTEKKLEKIAKLIRYYSLISTTNAGSGHPTSSLSAADLMACLLFGGIFRFDVNRPEHPNNDRLIFSKGHASPLFYAQWAAAGVLTEEELMSLRKFGSRLEGHPTKGRICSIVLYNSRDAIEPVGYNIGKLYIWIFFLELETETI